MLKNFLSFVSCFQASNSVKELQSFRKKLPAYKVKGEFLNAVSENQVQIFFFFISKF